MRKSVLSRSLVAVASLAIASATLAAVPVTAAPADVTRAQVLTAIDGVRTDLASEEPVDPEAGSPFSPSTTRALRALANRACEVNHDAETVVTALGMPTQPGDDADGLMVIALIADPSAPSSDIFDPELDGRMCAFGALAATDAEFSLSGSATIDFLTSSSHAISGSAYATPMRSITFAEFLALVSGEEGAFTEPSFAATGNASKTTYTTSSSNVVTPKTAQQKKAAKKVYDKALKSAKKSYTKAVKKAGNNKGKKAAAKKAHAKKRAAAKTAHQRAIAPTAKSVANTVSDTVNRPFSIALPALIEDEETPLEDALRESGLTLVK